MPSSQAYLRECGYSVSGHCRAIRDRLISGLFGPTLSEVELRNTDNQSPPIPPHDVDGGHVRADRYGTYQAKVSDNERRQDD